MVASSPAKIHEGGCFLGLCNLPHQRKVMEICDEPPPIDLHLGRLRAVVSWLPEQRFVKRHHFGGPVALLGKATETQKQYTSLWIFAWGAPSLQQTASPNEDLWGGAVLGSQWLLWRGDLVMGLCSLPCQREATETQKWHSVHGLREPAHCDRQPPQ